MGPPVRSLSGRLVATENENLEIENLQNEKYRYEVLLNCELIVLLQYFEISKNVFIEFVYYYSFQIKTYSPFQNLIFRLKRNAAILPSKYGMAWMMSFLLRFTNLWK